MMVRINLLPTKKRSVAGGGSDLVWKVVAVMVLLLVAQLALMYWLFSAKDEEVLGRSAELQKSQQAITELEREVSSYSDIDKEAKELEAREAALVQKASIRIGPQYVLDELKRILSLPSTRPSIKAARKAEWNVAWEASNVFLSSFKEVGDGKVHIVGEARTLDDVAEFWLRMRTSDMFSGVRLAGITEKKHAELESPLQHFEFYAQVNLYYQTEQGLALMQDVQQAAEPASDGAAGQAPGQPGANSGQAPR